MKNQTEKLIEKEDLAAQEKNKKLDYYAKTDTIEYEQ